ncbi:MAG: hypothetical protein EOP46_01390 [Sphingobacteriaceae bacterium]|nr:MAG: hypothetical protein EOP46_01390 [Sphingobacteriaceae bacterium]
MKHTFFVLFLGLILFCGTSSRAKSVEKKKLRDTTETAQSYYTTAKQQLASGQLKPAVENIIKALNLSEKSPDKKQRAEYYYTLSDIFFELREPEKIRLYANKGLELAREIKDSSLIARLTLNNSLTDIIGGRLGVALRDLKAAEKVFIKSKDTVKLAATYLYLRHVYHEKKDYKTAIGYVNKIPPLLKSFPKHERFKLHVECAMAQTYAFLHNYQQARYYYNRNIEQAPKFMDANDMLEMYELGAVIYENLGMPGVALSYLKKHKLTNDSINNILTKKAIYDAETKYQTTIKEKAISNQKLQLLNKDLELQKKSKYILFSVITIILLVLGSIITYLFYRNKNQTIELSLLKAQIHPHFLFNTLNNLYALSMSQSDKAPGIVLGLSSILRYILYECNNLKANLNREFEIISTYIALERVRYQHMLEVNLSIEGHPHDKTIVPLLLLPLVENSFKHGVSKLIDEAWINIEAHINDDKLIYKVSNNKPVADETETTVLKYGNIGLQNIRKRLKILYPERHRFNVINDADVFIVILELDL